MRRCASCGDSEDVTRVATYDGLWLVPPEHLPFVEHASVDLCEDCAYRLGVTPR